MRRTFAFMLALVLILSLSVSAFAAPGTDGSITITNATVGETYSIYKVFEATYSTDNTSVTYTIKPGDTFFAELFGDGTASNDYFEYHASTGVVTRKTGISDAKLFSYLGSLLKNVAPTATQTATETTVKFTNLTHGYYVIRKESGSTNGVTITNVNPTATVQEKNNLPGGDFDKTGDKSSANVGDEITWTLTFTATNYDDGKKVLSYTIKDSLKPAGWAKIDTTSIQVKVDGVVAPYTLVSGNDNGFEIEIPWVDDTADQNFLYNNLTSAIVVTYTGVIQASAASNPVNKNDAELEWDTEDGTVDPGIGGGDETDVYNLGFTKVDGTDHTKTLPGAEFKLYTDPSCSDASQVCVEKIADGVYSVSQKDGDGEPLNNDIIVSPDDGQVIIMGLEAGTYYLKETKAPAGYNKMDAAREITINETSGTSTMKINGIDYTVNHELPIIIENNSGVELPSTGGVGTMMMITFGTMVAIAFAVLMITQKKMSIYRD